MLSSIVFGIDNSKFVTEFTFLKEMFVSSELIPNFKIFREESPSMLICTDSLRSVRFLRSITKYIYKIELEYIFFLILLY